jgi:hypothetical protein
MRAGVGRACARSWAMTVIDRGRSSRGTPTGRAAHRSRPPQPVDGSHPARPRDLLAPRAPAVSSARRTPASRPGRRRRARVGRGDAAGGPLRPSLLRTPGTSIRRRGASCAGARGARTRDARPPSGGAFRTAGQGRDGEARPALDRALDGGVPSDAADLAAPEHTHSVPAGPKTGENHACACGNRTPMPHTSAGSPRSSSERDRTASRVAHPHDVT